MPKIVSSEGIRLVNKEDLGYTCKLMVRMDVSRLVDNGLDVSVSTDGMFHVHGTERGLRRFMSELSEKIDDVLEDANANQRPD